MVPPPTFILSSIYMHKEGKQKSNDIKYVQVNKTKVMIYCRSSKWMEQKPFSSNQLIKYNHSNVLNNIFQPDNFC